MKIVQVLALWLLVIGCNSCKKEVSYTISGQILRCNNGTLMPFYTNTKIDLFQQKNGSNYNSKVLGTTITDAQGNFSFAYATTNRYTDKLKIRSGGVIIEEIPLADINNLKVVLPAYNLVVSLNVLKTYTSNDTLFYGRPDSSKTYKVAGPFINGRLFKASNLNVYGNLQYGINEGFIPYKINNPFEVFERKIYPIENSKLCGDTVYVNIDVK